MEKGEGAVRRLSACARTQKTRGFLGLELRPSPSLAARSTRILPDDAPLHFDSISFQEISPRPAVARRFAAHRLGLRMRNGGAGSNSCRAGPLAHPSSQHDQRVERFRSSHCIKPRGSHSVLCEDLEALHDVLI